jgi:hypothetical protein
MEIMNLADLAALGSFVSGLAVLASLVYLSFQIRQSRLHQQASIRLGRAGRIVSMCFTGSDPAIAEAIFKGNTGADDITATQRAQYQILCRGLFYHCEEEFFQHKEGLANDAYFASFVQGTSSLVRSPGFRAQWKMQRPSFLPEFVAFMDKLLQDNPALPDHDAMAEWKAAVAAEKAGR